MITSSHASHTRASIANSNLVQPGPVTFDFTNGVIAQDIIGNPGSPIASQQIGDAVLTLTADAGSLVYTDETSFSGYDVVGLDGLTISVDLENPNVLAPAVVTLALDGGRTFDLTELSVLDLSAFGLTVNIRTDKTVTPVSFNIPAAQFDGGTQLPSDAVRVMLASEPAMQGIAWAELSNAATGEVILLQFDNIVLSNIESLSTAPVFVEPLAASVDVDQNGSALDLASLLHVNDPDAAETLTWSVVSQASHGIAQLTGATASGGSADITPGGTLLYTPTSGYAGNDSITIQVSDGAATATRTINFSVIPQTPGTPDLDAGADTGLESDDDVTAAATLTLSGTRRAVCHGDGFQRHLDRQRPVDERPGRYLRCARLRHVCHRRPLERAWQRTCRDDRPHGAHDQLQRYRHRERQRRQRRRLQHQRRQPDDQRDPEPGARRR
jgi:hypothetical protein